MKDSEKATIWTKGFTCAFIANIMLCFSQNTVSPLISKYASFLGAGTVAALLRQRGYPVAVWSRQSQMAHQPNEYCVIANMIGNAKVFAHLCMNTV
jgi:hypothetical protein